MILLEIFNTRELSTIFWMTILLSFTLINKNSIRGILSLLQIIIKLWWLCLTIVAYTIGSLFLIYKLHLVDIDIDLIKGSVYWFFGSAVVMVMSITKLEKDKREIKKIVAKTISLTVIVSFLINLYPLSFIVEIFLIPTLMSIGGLTAFSETKKEFVVFHKFMNGLTSLVGLALIIIALFKVVLNYKDFFSYSTVEVFLLPVVLTIMFIPFMYLLSLYSIYDKKRRMGS